MDTNLFGISHVKREKKKLHDTLFRGLPITPSLKEAMAGASIGQ
jgi:hypothetical protein